MQLKEIKEKVKRPTKFTSLAISEAERLFSENSTLKNEIKSLKERSPVFDSTDAIHAFRLIQEYSSAIDNYNRVTRTSIQIGLTNSGGSIVLSSTPTSNPYVEVYGEDIFKRMKESILMPPYKIVSDVSRYRGRLDAIKSNDLRHETERRMIEMSRSISVYGRSVPDDDKFICGFTVCNDTSNCGALFIYGIEKEDGISGDDFISVLNALKSHYSKRMFFGSDRESGSFCDLISEIDGNVSVQKCSSVRNPNSGNEIFTFQIYL